MKKVSIILCCYNEEGGVRLMIESLHRVMLSTDYDYEIVAVDDGSTDNTLEEIRTLSSANERVFYIEFSRNFGHQNALKAGLDYARGDCLVSMDADMQHPPELLPVMLKKWEEGYDVVYTRRLDNKKISTIKQRSSRLFYKTLNFLSDIELEQGTADFRLLDRSVANVLVNLKENDLFMRGMVKWIGFKQFAIDYVPNERVNGESKYTIQKMVQLASRGITSFSVKPLYIALYLGFFLAIVAMLLIPYVVINYFCGHTVPGWASTMLIITFFGGLQLGILGIIGLYLGKIFTQVKYRPNYIVRSTNIV